MGLVPLNATGSVGEAMAVKDAQGYDRFLSQALHENNTYRLYFPVVELSDDNPYAVNGKSILGAAYGGRNCDPKAVKCSFLPLTNFSQDEFGQLKDGSEMGKYARIASVFHEAKYRYAVQQAENEAKKLAEENGEPIDTGELASKKKKLDQEYHGDTVNDVNIPPIYMPVIRGTSVFTFVSAILVQLNPDGTPSKERTGVERITLNISKKKVEELNEVLKKLSVNQLSRDYIEVHYAYNGKDKNEAGRNAHFEYVSEDSELRTKYPEWWKQKGTTIETMMIHDVNMIATKNRNIANPPDEREVIINFFKYIAGNRVLCNYMDFEAPIVQAAAEDLLNIDTVRSMQKAKMRLESIIKERNDSIAKEEAEQAAEADVKELSSEQLGKVEDMQKAGSLGEIIEAAGGLDGFGEMSSGDEPEEL